MFRIVVLADSPPFNHSQNIIKSTTIAIATVAIAAQNPPATIMWRRLRKRRSQPNKLKKSPKVSSNPSLWFQSCAHCLESALSQVHQTNARLSDRTSACSSTVSVAFSC